MIRYTSSYGEIFRMFLSPSLPVQREIESMSKDLALVPGKYAAIHLRLRHPDASSNNEQQSILLAKDPLLQCWLRRFSLVGNGKRLCHPTRLLMQFDVHKGYCKALWNRCIWPKTQTTSSTTLLMSFANRKLQHKLLPNRRLWQGSRLSEYCCTKCVFGKLLFWPSKRKKFIRLLSNVHRFALGESSSMCPLWPWLVRTIRC